MVNLYDTHCHLNLNTFEKDLEEVIRRAESSSVKKILVPGIDLVTSRLAIALSERFENVYAAVGIHPNEALSWDSSAENQLIDLASHSKVVAIGEIGLDFYHNLATSEIQQIALTRQLQIAEQLDKPVVIHSRNALPALLPILIEWHSQLTSRHLAGNPGVLHAFEGDLSDGFRVIEHAFKIGIGGPVTYKNAHSKQELASRLPLDDILLETDAPFLAPHPHRGKRNEPAMVVEIAEKIALLRRESIDSIATATSRAADLLFGWSLLFDNQ